MTVKNLPDAQRRTAKAVDAFRKEAIGRGSDTIHALLGMGDGWVSWKSVADARQLLADARSGRVGIQNVFPDDGFLLRGKSPAQSARLKDEAIEQAVALATELYDAVKSQLPKQGLGRTIREELKDRFGWIFASINW